LIRNNDLLLSILLYDRNISLKDAPLVGFISGIIGYLLFESSLCESAMPVIPFVFILMIVVPMLFLFLARPVFIDIRNPRRNDITFLAGISHEQRISLFSQEIRNINRFIVLFVAVSWGFDLVVNLFFQREKFNAVILGLAVFPVLEILALSYGSVLLARRGVIGATKKDCSSSRAIGAVSLFGTILIKITWALAGIIVSPLHGRIRLITRRQLTDVFRYESVNSIAFPFVAVLIVILFNIALRESPKQFMQLLYVVGAYSIVLVNIEGLLESSMSLKKIPAYSFSIKEIFVGNCYMFLSLTIPVPVAYFLINFRNINNIIEAIGVLQFLNAYVYLVLISGSWHTLSAIPKRNTMTKSLLYGYLIVILPSIFIPVFGFLFPSIFYAATLIIERCLFSKMTLHYKFN
jgi:hypothetical protein